MKVLEEGKGELLAWMDHDEARRWVRENKRRDMVDKTMDLKEAVSKFVHDGCYLAMGGFGHIRISMAAIYEMIRQRKRHIILAGKTAVHDVDILVASGVVDKLEVAYCFGHELRGLSPASRRMVEEGKAKVVSEWSNAGFQWRFKAAAMGLPFIPTRVMLGTDTFRWSSAKVVEDPFSGKPICLLPACYPDVVFMHVHRCDVYGNCQIDGIIIEDYELARAAKRLIVTTEEIIPNEEIRREPWRTVIPYFLVDAVVEIPYGSHPCNMPYMYYFDEEHIAEWLELSRTPEGVDQYFEKYVYSVDSFEEYLEKIGGLKKLNYLKKLEQLRAPLKAPWTEKKKKK
ncbi:MAG: CoA transferase subunit A [Candidatus Freyarchaeota archaeon]|nr:CoA-transferase [Candidatus Freyrarchaeum guaymaensis]